MFYPNLDNLKSFRTRPLEGGSQPLARGLLTGRIIGEIVRPVSGTQQSAFGHNPPPPPVDPAKQLLPCFFGKKLQEFSHSVGRADGPTCSDCHAADHSVANHLAGPGDMWTAPLQVPPFLTASCNLAIGLYCRSTSIPSLPNLHSSHGPSPPYSLSIFSIPHLTQLSGSLPPSATKHHNLDSSGYIPNDLIVGDRHSVRNGTRPFFCNSWRCL